MRFSFEVLVHAYLHYKKVFHVIGNLAKIYSKLLNRLHLFFSQNLKDLKVRLKGSYFPSTKSPNCLL